VLLFGTGRAMVCSRGLSIQTTVISGTVWPQFAIQVLTAASSQIKGECWSQAVGDGSPE